ncbi:MAG: acyltransferase [Amphibacillus sp.]|uniref:Acetyltransferase n=1 Tax=Amphibacillus xylanus (strain ATCC 51415 / DSM 6626 / JCM 7361 / LMG 17667 / NBRC 15112 / Ep01) TaxID=698758 RepID=K0IWR7_AMPXN|nr:acyltransferase [Amphibacillus xylanus]NMA89847.1 acyltransferase [Amphibacillus sp.]BAM46819.1 hypothetical protein AXY_06870 [Amphibacillus xylanus NBRC 15112]
MRKTERYPVEGSNALWQMYKTVPFLKVIKNFLVIQTARYTPWLPMKNWLYRHLLGMKVGDKTAFALMVMVDLLFPERISVGKDTVIGYNTTILTHEYLIDEYRIGDVKIGDQVMIGANSTILPGVTIGDRATVAAGTVVTKDIEAGSFVGGNPMRVIYTKEEMEQRKKAKQTID